MMPLARPYSDQSDQALPPLRFGRTSDGLQSTKCLIPPQEAPRDVPQHLPWQVDMGGVVQSVEANSLATHNHQTCEPNVDVSKTTSNVKHETTPTSESHVESTQPVDHMSPIDAPSPSSSLLCQRALPTNFPPVVPLCHDHQMLSSPPRLNKPSHLTDRLDNNVPTEVSSDRSRLLTLPREIRDIIYSYLLLYNRPHDYATRDLPIVATQLLEVGGQLGAEANEYLRSANTWIAFHWSGAFQTQCAKVPTIEEVTSQLKGCYPVAKGDQSFVNSIKISLEGCYCCESSKRPSSVVFPYDEDIYENSMVPVSAWLDHRALDASLEIAQVSDNLSPKTARKLLRPFNRVRGLSLTNVKAKLPCLPDNGVKLVKQMKTKMNTSLRAERWLLSLKEEGIKLFQRNDIAGAKLIFNEAACIHWPKLQVYMSDARVCARSPRANQVKAIFADIAINYLVCVNTLVSKYPRQMRQQLPYANDDLRRALDLAQFIYTNFNIMLDDQRARLHFQTGRTYELMAEGLILAGKRKSAMQHIRSAAYDYYFARMLNKDDELILKALQRMERLGKFKINDEDAGVERIRSKETGEIIWEGDAQMFLMWGAELFIEEMDMLRARPGKDDRS